MLACSLSSEPDAQNTAGVGALGGGAAVGGAAASAGHGGTAGGGRPAAGGAGVAGSAGSGAGATGGVATGGSAGSAGRGGDANGGSAGEAASGGVGGAPAAGRGGADSAGGGNAGGLASSGSGGAGMGGANGGAAGSSGAQSKFLVFLLLGQSNMEGQPQPQAEDRVQDPRIKVLAYDDCAGVNREYGKWYTAYPPLHSCGGGVGPGDYFAKTLIESLPEDYTIGLVPCAVNGAPIDLFRKGLARTGYDLPPDNHWETGYEWIISRAREAQKTGVIRGILFHQGESDSGQSAWVNKVQGLVNDLTTDLSLGDIPFLAGELYHDGCCAGHNPLIQQLTTSLTNAYVISASGLNGYDQYHFDLAGQRLLGTRYGQKMQEVLTLP